MSPDRLPNLNHALSANFPGSSGLFFALPFIRLNQVSFHMPVKKIDSRSEVDCYGELALPANAYWGAATARSLLLSVEARDPHPSFLEAALYLEKSIALTNSEYECLDAAIARSISQAVDETLAGQWQDQFQTKLMQPDAIGAFFANVSEFLSNRAGEMLGAQPGSYALVNPLLHIRKERNAAGDFLNLTKLSLCLLQCDLNIALVDLERMLRKKALEFERDQRGASKQNAQAALSCRSDLPALLNGFGQEVGACARQIGESCLKLQVLGPVLENTQEKWDERNRVILLKLSNLSGLKLQYAEEKEFSPAALNQLALLSASLRGLTLILKQIASTLKTKLGNLQITVPSPYAISPGATKDANTQMYLRPDGSDNTSCELLLDFVAMVSCQLLALDLSISMALQQADGCELAMLPLLSCNLLSSMQTLKQTVLIFNKRCLQGLGVAQNVSAIVC